MPRALKIACYAALAIALAIGGSFLMFEREAVTSVMGTISIVLGVVVLPVVLGGLLVGLGHKYIANLVKGPGGRRH